MFNLRVSGSRSIFTLFPSNTLRPFNTKIEATTGETPVVPVSRKDGGCPYGYRMIIIVPEA